jgi:trk system potassium uptake protein TrkA
VTNGDNSNIMIARVARETFGVERVVARIYDPRRAAIYQRLGIPTVATVSWASERVLRHILPELSAVDWVDPSAKVCLIERAIPASWAGHLVSDLEEAGRARLVAIGRLGVAQIPKPDLVAQEGDIAYVAVGGDAIAAFDERLANGASGRH